MTRTIIDVRGPIEFRAGHVKGAINIPPRKLLAGAGELNDIPKSTELIVYCRTGNRSAASINILKTLGYNNVINGINKDRVEAEYL